MRRLTACLTLAVALLVGSAGIAEAAPDAPAATESVAAPAHTPWPNFTFDVCSFTMVSKMQLPSSQFFVHTADIQTVHFAGKHFVYCAARLIGGSAGSGSACWLIDYEANRLVDSWGAPRFGCN